MRTIRIPIVENRSVQAKLFQKLSDSAKKLFVVIAKLSKIKGDKISIDDLRNLGRFGTTEEIERLLYALESRGFGEVKVNGAEIYFIGNKILMQSVL